MLSSAGLNCLPCLWLPRCISGGEDTDIQERWRICSVSPSKLINGERKRAKYSPTFKSLVVTQTNHEFQCMEYTYKHVYKPKYIFKKKSILLLMCMCFNFLFWSDYGMCIFNIFKRNLQNPSISGLLGLPQHCYL